MEPTIEEDDYYLEVQRQLQQQKQQNKANKYVALLHVRVIFLTQSPLGMLMMKRREELIMIWRQIVD